MSFISHGHRQVALQLLCICVTLSAPSLTWAGSITGRVVFKGGRPSTVKVGYVGLTRDKLTVFNGASLVPGDLPTGVSVTTFSPRETRLDWDPTKGCRFSHTGMPPGRYLVYARCGERYLDWRLIALDTAKPEATVNFTWDPRATGSLKLIVNDGKKAYNVRISPLGNDARPLLGSADVPMYAGWDEDLTGTSIVLSGMKPGTYLVELRTVQKMQNPSGWSAIYSDAGTWSVTVQAGRVQTYLLR